MKLTKQDKAMLRGEFEKVWHDDDKMVDWCVKNTSGYIEAGGLVVTMDKPSIKKDFWFGEHTYDYDEVVEHADKCSKSVEYFKHENMSHCDAYNLLQALDGKDWRGYDTSYKLYVAKKSYCGQDDDCRLGYVKALTWGTDPREYFATRSGMIEHREIDDDEKAALREFLEDEVEKFDKRLDTYLKRYGLSKCHYGVYWADR